MTDLLIFLSGMVAGGAITHIVCSIVYLRKLGNIMRFYRP
jgi:hypothetical protein